MSQKPTSLLREFCCGSMAGLLATVPMSATMLVLQKLLPPASKEKLEPRQITEAGLEASGNGNRLTEPEIKAVSSLAHFAFGASVGAAYPYWNRALSQTPARGAAYGLAVYAASYLGWLPAAGVLPPPHRRPAGRNLLLIAAHLVWGQTLQSLYSQLDASDRK